MSEPSLPEVGAGLDAPKRRRSALARIFRATLAIAGVVAVGIVALGVLNGRWLATPILSGSMRPGFAVGGLVICERVPVADLAVRDVMIFRRPDDPSQQMIHRIIAIKHDPAGHLLIRTQGDANPAPDPWTVQVPGNSVYVASWSVPLIGYAAVDFQNHRGIVLLGAGFVVLAIAASFGRGAKKRDGTDLRDGDEHRIPSPADSTRSAGDDGCAVVAGQEASKDAYLASGPADR